MRTTLLTLPLSLVLAVSLPSQNCSNTSIGATPINDLGAGTYGGFVGGLYPAGQNTPPAAHAAAGAAIAQGLGPLAPDGSPDPNGRIVLVSIGMSNTTQEFSRFVQISDADPNRNGSVVVVDGAQGGQDARRIADPNAAFWPNVDQRLAQRGVTPQQVQVAWVKEAVARPTAGFPAHAQELQRLLGQIAQILKSRYPNIRICFLSSRIYAGYATTTLNPEPFAYESGFSVKWLIEAQINGAPDLSFDPNNGPVRAPWLAWGPYLWADGLTPRSDGLIWRCEDLANDGTHPSQSGREKVAQLLNGHFTQDAYSTPWYLGGGGQDRAAVFAYGAGCPGTNGVPRTRVPTTPFLGNQSFRIGVSNARPQSPAVLFWSTARASIAVAGTCRLLIDPTLALPPINQTTNSNGASIVGIPVPNQQNLIGLLLDAQWLVLDPRGAPFPGIPGVALTGGTELRLGIR